MVCPVFISITSTLGLKWSHITTNNQCAHSTWELQISSSFQRCLDKFRKTHGFLQQVLSATTSSSPSAPAAPNSRGHHHCLGPPSKLPSTGRHHLHCGCAVLPGGPQPVCVPLGTAPSLVLQGRLVFQQLAEIVCVCGFFQNRLFHVYPL